MQVYKWWLLIFHPTYISNDYQFGMQNQLLLLTLTRSQDSQMIQQWQSRYPNVFRLHGLFRLLNTAPFALHGYAAGFSNIERVRYYHCAQYGRRTYGANMPAIPVSRYQLV
jgi:hypothetical protein